MLFLDGKTAAPALVCPLHPLSEAEWRASLTRQSMMDSVGVSEIQAGGEDGRDL